MRAERDHSRTSGTPDSEGVLATLVENHRQFLAFLERRLRSREEAEDVLQEAFVRGIEKSDDLRDVDSAVAWFYRMLRNTLIDRHRRRDAEERALERFASEQSGVQPPVDEELMREVCDCVSRLLPTIKPEYASILQRVELEEIPVKEYAARERITANNASVRLSRAREALRKQLVRSCSLCITHACEKCECECGSERC